jgi:PKD repeat protein
MTKNPTTPASTVLRFVCLLALFSGMNALAQPLSGILPKYGRYVDRAAMSLRWNSMPNALNYEVELAQDPNFTINYVSSGAITPTTWQTTLNSTGTWYWRVVGFDGANTQTSAVNQFFFFEPNDLSGNTLWLSADSSVNISGSSVAQWNDISGNNHSFIQSTALDQPILTNAGAVLNNKPIVRFDGVSDFLNGGDILNVGTNSITTFIVARGTGSYFAKFGSGTTPFNINGCYNIGGEQGHEFAGAAYQNFATTNSTNYHILNFRADRTAGTGRLYRNLAQVAGANLTGVTSGYNLTTTNPFLLGRYRLSGTAFFMNGDIAEVIFYNVSLNDSLRGIVGNYLSDKYAPPINLGRDSTITAGFCPITLTVPTGYTSLLWSTGATSASINVSTDGTYWVRGTNLFGQISFDTIQVTYPTIPPPINTAICVNESNTWSADMGPGFTYLWSTGATTPSIDITTPGTYSVTVTGSGGCSRSSGNYTFSVDNYANTAYLGNDTTLCAGNQIALQVGAGETVDYFWNGLSTADQSSFWVVDTTGNYFLESINVNGCVARDTINITIVGVAPVANFSTGNVCDGTNAVFTDLSTAAGSDPLVIWNWNFGDSNTSSIQNPSHLYASSGSYPVILYVESEGGCGAFANGSVQVYANPTASFAVENTCINETIAFASTSTDGTAEINAWLWNFGQPASGMGNTSVLPNPTRNYNELGTFNVTLLVTDLNSCSDEVTVPVTILDSPVAQFTASDICAGVPITFVNTSTVGAPLFIQDYLWDFGDNTFSPMPSPNKTYNTIGFHTINLTVTASNGCTDIVQVQQFTHAYPVPNFANSPACAGTWTTLTDVSTVATGTVASSSWEINLTNNLTGSPTAFVFTNAGPNNVKLTTTSDFGCTKDTMKIITVNPALNASFTTSPLVVNAGDPVLFTNTTVGATVGSWDFGDGNTSLDIEPVHTYSTQWIDSTMTVEYIVSNSFGCVDTAYTNLPVFKARFDLAVQNIFLDEVNGYYNIGVQLRNLGTSVIDYADVEIRLSNGTALKDRYENSIQGGQSVVMVFPSQPSAFFSAQNGFEDWICAEATPFNAANLSDEDLSNNRFCKNIEGEAPVLIGPNPNPATDQFTFELIISTESTLTVDLTDSRGRAVRNYFDNTTLNKGLYTITEPTLGLESGVYYLRMSSGEVKVVRKVVVN